MRAFGRRVFLVRLGSLAVGTRAVSVLGANSADATPAMMREALSTILGEAQLREGRIRFDVPPLVENGNAVPITISVESPMTEGDHVKAIHVFNEKNPQPYVITARLGPRAGRASLATRIKLADTQRLLAVAEMSDGTFWSASADVIVTIAACIEDVK